MQQDLEENKILENKKETESESDDLEKSGSGNDEKEDSLSPNLPSLGYSYATGLNNDEEKDSKYPSSPGSGPENKRDRLTPQKAASPLVINWLQDNYESADGTSLPRNTLYTHYLGYCHANNIEPVNAASFGKLIRSIFPNLKTRRLGTRGHSKYHYYGIQIKQSSDLRLPSFGVNEGIINSTSKPKNRLKKDYDSSLLLQLNERDIKDANNSQSSSFEQITITQGASNYQLPEFILPENISLPHEIGFEHAQSFMYAYRKHCQQLVDTVYKQQFSEVEKLLRHFWQTLPNQFRIVILASDILDQVTKRDHATYRAMALVLLPNVLQALPVNISQGIRQFAKSLEPWLASALDGLPTPLVLKKLIVAKRFAQSLHKQASINHLTQAARAVLQNPNQVQQMIIDWNRLDFEFIKTQASWVCQCGDDIILSAQEDFKKFLTDRASLEQWATWLQELVHRFLAKCTDTRDLVFYSQQLLLKWSYYSTLIIRDLTIRNASSFGSFHLLRTLFDEYIIYLIDSKMAAIPQFMIPPDSLYMNHSGDPMSNTGHPSNGSVDSFSLENLLNKDSRIFPKHLPFPFGHESTVPIGQTERTIPSDEDYTRILHSDMLHTQKQYSGVPRMASHQYGRLWSGENMEPTGSIYPKATEESIASNLETLRSNLGPLNLKRNHPEPPSLPNMVLKSANIPYNTNYSTTQTADSLRTHPNSLESLLNQQMGRENEQNKKIRSDNGQTAEVK